MDSQSMLVSIIPEEPEQPNISGQQPRDAPTGILKLEVAKRLSTELKFTQKEILSPQPSVDRLSVTFAEDSLKSESSKGNLNLTQSRMQQLQQQQSLQHQQDRVQFPEEAREENDSDEDDYSASVNAIIQRRASTRRSKKQSRRASSPFLPETPCPERRRSSVFTTSSGDTAITVDDNAISEVSQDEIFENIKLHKEVLSQVKMQPWSMRKKLKLVVQAKAYIKKHEGQLQERLAQSHSTKDMLARWNIVLIKKWQKWKRELTNMSMWFIPWELKIKEIESHFGSVVASYFTFLRWLFWVNIVIAVVIISFVTIPEIITADPEAVKDRKFVLPEEKYNSTNFLTLWDFEGVFKYSPLFYGWYTNKDYNDSAVLNSYERKNLHGHGYRLPFAYFITGLVVYAFSFFATLRKMAENSRMSKLSEKDDECIFSWKLFTAWDYMIGNAETAHNRVASIVMGFKEALVEEAEKKRESRNWKVICFRVLVNTLVAGLLSCSAFAVVIVVKRSTEPEANSTVWRRNEITVVMSLITSFFPMLFEVLGFVEQYHPRKQLRLQLARIMVLNLLNLYSLIFALFDKITDMTVLLQGIKENLTKPQTTDVSFYVTPTSSEIALKSFDESTSTIHCFCNDSSTAPQAFVPLDMLLSLAHNLSTIAMPTLTSLVNNYSSSSSTEGPFFNTTEALFNSSLLSSTVDELLPVTDNFSSYYENSSLSWYENTTTDNITFGLPNVEFSLDDVKDLFVDYLTFVLSPFGLFNNTDLSTLTIANFSVNDSLIIENTTLSSPNLTTTDYEYFKSTIRPLFSNTFPQEEQRFDTELTSLFEEVTTTIESFPDIFSTTTFPTSTEGSASEALTENTQYYYCQSYCQTIHESKSKTSWPSTVASTAVTMVSYGGEVEYRKILNYTMNAKLRSLCWETMFGQELIKLTVMDLIVTGLSILMMDFFRGIFVRVMNRCWCWDLEKKFPQYGDFKVAENILHLVNNQGMVWMGMFFSPGIVVLNVVKLYVMMYLRAWAVLTCNVPHEIIFRASRSNNFYYALLLMMLFLCVLPVGYAIVWIEPSWHCGPFSGYQKIFHIFTKTIRANIPEPMHRALDYIASPGIVIPLLLLLVLIIYYLVSLTGALREANNDLKTQLRRERTEERRKMFQIADRRRRGGSGESNDQTPFSKWKKLLGNLPSARSCDDAHQESEDLGPSQPDEDGEDEKVENKGKVFFTKLIKKALGKSSTSDEEQDGTDTDQHDSLPYDSSRQASKEHKAVGKTSSGGSSELQILQGIVSKWTLRRNSQQNENGKFGEDKAAKDHGMTKTVTEYTDNIRTSDEIGQPVTYGRDLENQRSAKSRVKNKTSEVQGIRDKKDRKSALNVTVHKTVSPRPRRKEKTNTEGQEQTDITKPGGLKDITHYKYSEGKTPNQSSGPDENVPMKNVIEEQPGMSRATKKSTSKPRKAIIELDEDKMEQEQSIRQIRSASKDDNATHVSRQTDIKKTVQRQGSSSSIWTDNIPVITISKTTSEENILDKEDVCESSKINSNQRKGKRSSSSSDRRSNTVVESKQSTPKVDGRRKFVFKDEDQDSSSDERKHGSTGDPRSDNSEVLTTHLEKINQRTSFRPRVKCMLKRQPTAVDEDVIIHFGEDLERDKADKKLIIDLVNKKVAETRGLLEDKNLPSTSRQANIFEGEFSGDRLEPIKEGTPSKLDGGSASDISTSDDTEVKDDDDDNSVDTILNSPYYYASEILSPARDFQEEKSPMDQNIDDDVELDDGSNEGSSKTDTEEFEMAKNLQHPSVKSSSRSQTESSSYYQE